MNPVATANRPAILGGHAAFSTKQPIVRPVLPNFESMSGDLAEILSSGMVTKGQNLRKFEEACAAHLRVKHAVAVTSCTSGLMLAYQGLGLTGDVVVPSFTFLATVSALVWAGLRPVFADVDEQTTNLDPAAAEAAITPRTTAIVAVHNFGNPAAIKELEDLAQRKGLKLVFDAAHGFGALYQGVPVGPQGCANVYSLSPTKLLIAGEGGIVATNDDTLANWVRVGREYGMANYDSLFAGINSRMSEFNALLGLRSLEQLEGAARRRNEVASRYREQLGRIPGIDFQKVLPGNRCSYKDFSITIDEEQFGLPRDGVLAALAAENIDTRTYYNPPVHRQQAYKQFAPADEQAVLPRTLALSAHSVSLPLWSRMDDATVDSISEALRRIHEHASDIRRKLE